MTETVVGGRYLGVDGQYHDAHGSALELEPEAATDPWGGMASALVRVFMQAGHVTPEAVAALSDDEIMAIKGLGPAAVLRVREALG